MTRVTVKLRSGKTETHWFTYAHVARTWLLLNGYTNKDADVFEHISGRSEATMRTRKIYHHQA